MVSLAKRSPRGRTPTGWNLFPGTATTLSMERWGLLLLIAGGAIMAVNTIAKLLEWYLGIVSPAGIRRTFVIGVILMGLGAVMMGIAPVPGGF